MSKPLVIYHANCADGFGAAFSCWLKLGDEAEYVACSYGDKNFVIPPLKDRDVYILDFSFSKETMNVFFEDSKRVVWLDHHKTAFEMWCGDYFKGIAHYEEHTGKHIKLDDNKSGAMLAWEYFHPDTEVPRFVRHIDDYDRWCFQIDGTKAFNKAIWSYAPWSFTQWRDWFYDVEEGFNHTYWADFYTEGSAILRAHDQNVQSVVKGSARKCRIACPGTCEEGLDYSKPYPWEWNTGGYFDIPGLAANCPHHLTSDVGHELANQSGTFGLCWTLSKEGLVAKCSLRSNGDYDVSAIAKSFGGGGHRNAAGFEVPIDVLLGWLK